MSAFTVTRACVANCSPFSCAFGQLWVFVVRARFVSYLDNVLQTLARLPFAWLDTVRSSVNSDEKREIKAWEHGWMGQAISPQTAEQQQ